MSDAFWLNTSSQLAGCRYRAALPLNLTLQDCTMYAISWVVPTTCLTSLFQLLQTCGLLLTPPPVVSELAAHTLTGVSWLA